MSETVIVDYGMANLRSVQKAFEQVGHAAVITSDPGLVATETDYPTPFASAVWHENVFATQFHPEKSQRVGLAILHKFATLR